MQQAISVANYYLTLTYCFSTANVVADALSRKQEELKTQKDKDKAVQTRAFLLAKQINVSFIKDISSNLATLAVRGILAVNAIKVATADTFILALPLDKPYKLINQILSVNYRYASLQLIQEKASKANSK